MKISIDDLVVMDCELCDVIDVSPDGLLHIESRQTGMSWDMVDPKFVTLLNKSYLSKKHNKISPELAKDFDDKLDLLIKKVREDAISRTKGNNNVNSVILIKDLASETINRIRFAQNIFNKYVKTGKVEI